MNFEMSKLTTAGRRVTKRTSTMKTMKIGMLTAMAVLVAATATVSVAQEKSAAEPQVLHDGDRAKTVRFKDLHQTRFIELFFGTRDPKTGKLVAPCFNTMYTSNELPASKDTSPQALVESLDLEKLAKDYGVAKVMLNGPKIWMPDWVEVAVGTERNFNGMTAGAGSRNSTCPNRAISKERPTSLCKSRGLASGDGPRARRWRFWTIPRETPGY